MAHPVYGDGQLRPVDVTVVVPVRDDADMVADLRMAAGDVAEVIVVDDGSQIPIDGAALRNETARGPAAARNAGWRRARTALVAFLDADTALERGWLEPLLRHFEDPTVVAVAPRVRSMDGDTILARYEYLRSPLDLGAVPGPVDSTWPNPERGNAVTPRVARAGQGRQPSRRLPGHGLARLSCQQARSW
ncbi:glycosyltransferase [Saccharopolyspora sp. ASAGF58]|uniref:glycosyltransferase n=1 Tax=Saccharopolyspora sp. ASAGF58 TaxID=2719023 RepID=UPI001FF0C469|nr:glycosyltransferase [Saccharopolyspora sp. ASAGF58]